MSTLEASEVTVDNLRSRGRPTRYKKRELPEALIRQLHGQGLKAKAIAAFLNKEKSTKVSYKTVQRILTGQRVVT